MYDVCNSLKLNIAEYLSVYSLYMIFDHAKNYTKASLPLSISDFKKKNDFQASLRFFLISLKEVT